jgi:mono/diheme cytochrome c family protein
MKTTSLTKLVVVASLFTAIACWNAAAADGKELWDKNCAACHGKDGKGETKMGKKVGCKDYSDAKAQAEVTDEKILKVIKEGLTEDGKDKMKSFAEKVNDEEAKAIVAYFRTLKK